MARMGGLSHAERMRRRNGGGRRCGSWFRTVAMCGPLVLVLGLAYAYMHVIADHHEQQVQRNSILRGAIGSGGIGETLTNSLLQSSSSPSPPMPPQPMAESIASSSSDSPLRPSSSLQQISSPSQLVSSLELDADPLDAVAVAAGASRSPAPVIVESESPAAVSAGAVASTNAKEEQEPLDDSYFVVFSTGCSEFQDWQSLGVYSSAEAVGQRGVVLRIASGCTEQQKAAIRHATAHLPRRCRVHFAPNTNVKDHAGRFYKYANKPLGMMHWLLHAEDPVPPDATVALIDPDMFFLRPLWHDSFDAPSKYFASGGARKTPMPPAVAKGTMVAQRYGIGGAPWTKRQSGRNGQKAWGLKEYFTAFGRPNSPALAPDLDESRATNFFSIGAPYIALASDWLPIASNWTGLMPMAVERNFGNLAEMYAMVIAVADYGIRPVMIDNLMVSNVGAGGEGWPWVDKLPMDRGCDPKILTDPEYNLPTFLHYCQRYEIEELKNSAAHQGLGGGGNNGNDGAMDERGAFWMYTKYQVPDEILHCPAGSRALEGSSAAAEGVKKAKKKGAQKKLRMNKDGFLPEPPTDLVATKKANLRNMFAHCAATRATNQAAKDYRRWFCEVEH